MRLLQVYPAIAALTDMPRSPKPDTVEAHGHTWLVFRGWNVYLDTKKLATRVQNGPYSTYCLVLSDAVATPVLTATSDDTFNARLTHPDKIDNWIAGRLAIAADTEAYTRQARAAIAIRREASALLEAQAARASAERKHAETEARITRNRATFKSGGFIDLAGFEELCKLADIAIPIQTLGSIRKNVTNVSKTRYQGNPKAKPAGIWLAIADLTHSLDAPDPAPPSTEEEAALRHLFGLPPLDAH